MQTYRSMIEINGATSPPAAAAAVASPARRMPKLLVFHDLGLSSGLVAVAMPD